MKMKHPHIPRTWSAEHALDMSELLQALLDHIWLIYGDEMTRQRQLHDPPPEWRDDEDEASG